MITSCLRKKNSIHEKSFLIRIFSITSDGLRLSFAPLVTELIIFFLFVVYVQPFILITCV